MDRPTFRMFHDIYWSHKKLIIGPGLAPYTVSFLKGLPRRALRSIKAIEINFSIADVHTETLRVLESTSDDHSKGQYAQELSRWDDPSLILEWQLPYDQFIDILNAKLPQDFFDLIEEYTYEAAFCPGYDFLQQWKYNTHFYVWRGKTYNIMRPELLILSKSVHKTYALRMWKGKIMVLEKGAPYSTDWFQYVPWANFRDDITLHYQLTRRNLGHLCAHYRDPMPPEIRKVAHAFKAKLMELWLTRIDFPHVNSEDVVELKIELRDCYGFMGEWLGFETARRLRGFGRPTVFEIFASDNEKRKPLQEIFRAIRLLPMEEE
ncbi:MAG: hypothetical protein Q9166_005366 [cf. Caloplaca sp. 2 TL-2023]